MIRLQCETDRYKPDFDFVENIIRHALASRWADEFEEEPAVDIVILDDAEITVMNKQFKNRDRATDVLAFDDGTEDPDTGETHLGDVAVSIETAAREAENRGVPMREELALYCLHGVLHLLGLRDGTDEERAEMRTAEREVLAEVGVIPNWD